MSGIGVGVSDTFLEHLDTGDIIVVIPPDPPVVVINSLTLTLPVPNNTKTGDLLVALISTDGNPTIAAPAGWTDEDNIGGTAKSFIYWRAANDSEPANYTWTLDGVEDGVGAIIKIKKADTTFPIHAKVKSSGTGSTIVVPSITTTIKKTMLMTIISLNDGILIDESTLKKNQQNGLWLVNSSGLAIGSVGSSASYKTLKKAKTYDAYNLKTVGLAVTDYYIIEIAIAPVGEGIAPPVPLGPLYDAYIYLYDKKGAGVDAGASTSGAWRTRDMTDEVEDTDNLCTLAANQFTLDAGTYRCLIAEPNFRSNEIQARLYNITDGSMELLGTSGWNFGGNSDVTTWSFVQGKFTIAAQKTFEVQYRVSQSKAGNGLGVSHAWGDNIYTTVELWRET